MSDDRTPEADDIPGARTAAIMVGLIAFVGLCAGVLWWFDPQIDHPAPHPAAFEGPGLEVAPVSDYEGYMARQRALLAGGEGRTPIDEAMAAVAERGTLAPEEAP